MDEACILVCMKNRKLKTTVRKKLQKFPGVISEKLEDFTGTEPTLDPVMVIFDKQFIDQSLKIPLPVLLSNSRLSNSRVLVVGDFDKRRLNAFRKSLSNKIDDSVSVFVMNSEHTVLYLDQILNAVFAEFRQKWELIRRTQNLENEVHNLIIERDKIRDERNRFTDSEKELVLHQVSASINHEINNPLAVILGQISLLLGKKETLPAKVIDRLEKMAMAGRKIQEITENLRSADFSSLIDYVGEVKMIDIRTDRKTKFQPNIMVVDDDPNMSELFYEMLSEKGYWVATMNSGIAAVEALSEKRFDLALVDLMMPEMNGVETIKLLKEKQPDIRIILHTGYANDEKINEAVSAGAMRVLYKPFQQEYLLKMVRQVVSMEDKKL